MREPEKLEMDGERKPEYISPTIATYREDEILEEVGPAQAYTGSVPFGF
jgi:hypothetical protein